MIAADAPELGAGQGTNGRPSTWWPLIGQGSSATAPACLFGRRHAADRVGASRDRLPSWWQVRGISGRPSTWWPLIGQGSSAAAPACLFGQRHAADQVGASRDRLPSWEQGRGTSSRPSNRWA